MDEILRVMKDRISWIDIARGLGIIFVIYAHVLDRNSIRFLFYAFHMPLFFFLTGIVHHHKKSETFISFLRKNTKRILIPYFLFAFLTYGWWIITQNNGFPTLNEFSSHMRGILYGSGARSGLFFNTLLWFLPCLFAAKVGFELLTRISDSSKKLVISLFIFAAVGFAFSILFPELKLPFHIETALSAVVFVGAGYLFYRYYEKIHSYFENNVSKLLIISLLLLLISAIINYSLTGLQNDMRLNRLNNPILFYISSFSGISTTILISMKIGKEKLLEFLGKISLYLFILHPLILYHIKESSHFWVKNSLLHSLNNIFLAPLYSAISIVLISISYLLIQSRWEIQNKKEK